MTATQQWGYLALGTGAGLLFKAVGAFIWPTQSNPWFLLAASLVCLSTGLYLFRRNRSA